MRQSDKAIGETTVVVIHNLLSPMALSLPTLSALGTRMLLAVQEMKARRRAMCKALCPALALTTGLVLSVGREAKIGR